MRESSLAQVEHRGESIAEEELQQCERHEAVSLSASQLALLQVRGAHLRAWETPTTTDQARMELLRMLPEQGTIDVTRAPDHVRLPPRWRGGAILTLNIAVPRFRPVGPRPARVVTGACADLAA